MKITLHLDTTQNAWMANFHDDPAVIKAFGCTLVPTAFTSRARPQDVLHAIRQLNPTANVQLGA